MTIQKVLDEIELTPTQRRIYATLRDGCLHTKSALHVHLWDDQIEDKDQAVSNHIADIRKKLNPLGFDVVMRTKGGRRHYMMCRLVTIDDTPGIAGYNNAEDR